jgi:hypothetical protein
MINREEMEKRAKAHILFGYSNRTDRMVDGGPNPTLKVTAGKRSFCLCEEHFATFGNSVKRGELRYQGVLELQGNWAKNTKFTTQVVNGVCPICAD